MRQSSASSEYNHVNACSEKQLLKDEREFWAIYILKDVPGNIKYMNLSYDERKRLSQAITSLDYEYSYGEELCEICAPVDLIKKYDSIYGACAGNILVMKKANHFSLYYVDVIAPDISHRFSVHKLEIFFVPALIYKVVKPKITREALQKAGVITCDDCSRWGKVTCVLEPLGACAYEELEEGVCFNGSGMFCSYGSLRSVPDPPGGVKSLKINNPRNNETELEAVGITFCAMCARNGTLECPMYFVYPEDGMIADFTGPRHYCSYGINADG